MLSAGLAATHHARGAPGGGNRPQSGWHSPSVAAAAAQAAADEDGRARGGYKCSKCGLPKKGHVCAYQPRLRRRDEDEPKEKCDMSCQVTSRWPEMQQAVVTPAAIQNWLAATTLACLH